MEEGIHTGDLRINVVRQSSLRPNGTFKSTLSERSTPKSSPTYRRSNSGRTPRREGRGSGSGLQWFRSNRLIYWLLLITLWTYLGFYVQSRWAHGDNEKKFLGFGGKIGNGLSGTEQNRQQDLLLDAGTKSLSAVTDKVQLVGNEKIDVVLATSENKVSSGKKVTVKKKSERAVHKSRGKASSKRKTKLVVESNDVKMQGPDIPQTNSSYGVVFGPFGSIEDKILEWSPEKRTGTCNRKGQFARLVWSRKFMVIFHELSMTGAPLSMLELSTELLSCGASVSAVVLSKKGGLMSELAKRRIKVLEDRADLSFKAAMKADLVIAGSAVCTSWIDQYIEHFPPGGSQILWWIMENRREYFDRAKIVLDRVKMVAFLAESQRNKWLTWCEEEKIKLRYPPAIVPLSVNDELAFVAGISCSLNTPSSSPEMMLEKRKSLRHSIRQEMGLADNDMLVMSLSSINPGKGQILLIESLRQVIEQGPPRKIRTTVKMSEKDHATLAAKHHLRSLLQEPSEPNNKGRRALKVLIGSVGSKSNKVPYVNEILSFLSQNPNVSKSVLWTFATTHVTSLYSAADVYVINAQGLGETFGRVTIEAMAFGLPVLGTDAGGTKEIVRNNVTGLLHPVGLPGTPVLAQNLKFLLENPTARERMGSEGRKVVEKMYLKRHMYEKLAEVLYKCMTK